MAKPADPSPSCHTTFLVPNLHCPSCASFIQTFLYSLRPTPLSVSTSILTHTITVQHDASLTVSAIAQALDKAGYGVYSAISHPVSGDASPQADAHNAPDNDARIGWFQRAVQQWKPIKRNAADEEARRKRHMEHCDQCRVQEREDTLRACPSLQMTISEKPSQDSWSQQSQRPRSTDLSISPRDDGDAFIVVHSTAAATKVFQASISVSGMSCSSCVGKITSALDGKPWVTSASVSLVTQNASVQFHRKHHAEELVKIIDDIGYEPSLESVDEMRSPAGAGPHAGTDTDLWKETAAIRSLNPSKADEAKGEQVNEMAGKGMKGSFLVAALPHPIEFVVGNEAFMTDYSVIVTSAISATLDSWTSQGKSIVLVAARVVPPGEPSSSTAWTPVAIFGVSDPLRTESAAVVNAIQRQGIDVWMISGDNPTTAYAVGAVVGIPQERIIAGVLPEQKADKIKYLQRSQLNSNSHPFFGRRNQRRQQRAIVGMVGDGVNDSPALTVADVGIAIGSGSDVAISAAEFVLIAPSLTTLLTLINLSRTVFRRVKFNFGWALCYNLVALPIAAGVLYPVRSGGQHIKLDPVWASLAMALSSLSVICSSLLLRSGLPIVGFRDSRTLEKGA